MHLVVLRALTWNGLKTVAETPESLWRSVH